MADVKKLAPIIGKWEGKFVNDPADKGGATNMGITIGTWKQIGHDKDGDGDIDVQDIQLLDYNDFCAVLKRYWNRWVADSIINQSVADILVDWVWSSGSWGIKLPQRILGLKEDGIVGVVTLKAINSANQKELFEKIFKAREEFYRKIVKRDPSQQKFIKGWLNRLNDFKYRE